MPRVLLLMTTRTYRATAFLDAAERLGLRVTVGSDQEQALATGNPAGNLTLPFSPPESGAAAVAQFAGRHPLHAVLATDDDGVVVAAAASAALGLPHNPVDAVRAAHDKHLTRLRLRAAGLRCPAFERIPADVDAKAVSECVGFPCVVKPLSLAASRGVIRADDLGELRAALRRAAAIVRREESADGGSTGGVPEVLVESYIPGAEVALEGLVEDGELRPLAIYDKPDPLEGPFFEETLYITPSRLPEPVREQVIAETAAAVRALGLRTGPVHAELRVNDDGAWILEVAPRTIGGLCARTLRFRRGNGGEPNAEPLSLEELVLLQALGHDVSGFERDALAAGVMMLPIRGAGVLVDVRGRDRALAAPGIEDLVITIPIGGHVVPLPEGSRYLGFLFARAERPEQVERMLRDAYHRLEIDVVATG